MLVQCRLLSLVLMKRQRGVRDAVASAEPAPLIALEISLKRPRATKFRIHAAAE
jgi:hypothetical protein